MSKQDFSEIFGPAGAADYSAGDPITFVENGETLHGEVLYTAAPGQTVTGRHHPTEIWVDAGDGFPHCVYVGQVVEE